MKRIAAALAFAVLALVIVMLLVRMGALQKQIAQLRRDRPRPERIVVTMPAESAEPRVPDARQPRELPFPFAAPNPVDTLVPKFREAPAAAPPPESRQPVIVDLSRRLGAEIAASHVVVLFQNLGVAAEGEFVTTDPFGGLDLTDAQRARIDIWTRQRDAEEGAARRRWDEIIKAEMTPEQHRKFEEPAGVSGLLLQRLRLAEAAEPESP